MAEIGRGQTRQFQHDRNVSSSTISVSAWLSYVAVKHGSFSMAVMCRGQTSPFQHVRVCIMCCGHKNQFQHGCYVSSSTNQNKKLMWRKLVGRRIRRRILVYPIPGADFVAGKNQTPNTKKKIKKIPNANLTNGRKSELF